MLKTLNQLSYKNKLPNCIDLNNYTIVSNNNVKLKNLNAIDLIAIEQASEVIKQCILHKGTFLEQVLKKIAKSSSIGETSSLGVIEFEEGFEKNIGKVRYNKSKYVIGLLEKNLDENGGHYGCFIFNTVTKKAEVFDSMQIKNQSNHTNSYLVATSKIFNIPLNSVTSYKCGCTWRQSCQPTGGFINTKSSYISIQDPDSQHHFCYMESLLHLAEKLLNLKSILPVYDRPTMLDSGNPELRIYVIKRWIFALVHMIDPPKNMSLKNYLYSTFTKVWYSDQIVFSAKDRVWVKRKNIRSKPKFFTVEVPCIYRGQSFNSKSSILDAVKFSHLIF